MDRESYEKGCASLQAEDYRAAKREFVEALKSIDDHHELYGRVASYLGLAQVLTSDRSGLLLCRDAASSDAGEADVYLNLACAEWHANNRKRALEAVHRGREIAADNPQLEYASTLIDSRRRNILPFLSREHLLNRTLGRMLRKDRGELTVHMLLYCH
jgi:hypothetical protein